MVCVKSLIYLSYLHLVQYGRCYQSHPTLGKTGPSRKMEEKGSWIEHKSSPHSRKVHFWVLSLILEVLKGIYLLRLVQRDIILLGQFTATRANVFSGFSTVD